MASLLTVESTISIIVHHSSDSIIVPRKLDKTASYSLICTREECKIMFGENSSCNFK